MKQTELTCTSCNATLNSAFAGKAEARDWDMDKVVCVDCRNTVNGARVVPST